MGVISLGLHICQGRVSYIGKYKSTDKEIKDYKSKMEGLQLILEGLPDTLSRVGATDPPPSAKFKVALRMITDWESGTKEAEDILSIFEITCAQGFLSTLNVVSTRALYPFRRDA